MSETPALTVQIRQRGSVSVMDMHGDLDGRAQAVLDDAWTRAIATAPVALVLHFGGVRYVNSTGIALVVGLLGRARAVGIPLRAVGLTDHYRHIFEITRLADFLTILSTEDDAVADSTAPA